MNARKSALRPLTNALGHLVAAITAALGSACGAGSSRPLVAADDDRPDHEAARAHGHGGTPGGHATGHADHPFADAEALASALDDPARDAWQRPDDVLRAMEIAPTMSVADVGAGTGYFAVRLARAVPAGEVTATDIEPDMVRFVNERAHREGLQNLRAILATEAGSGLARESVDRILVVHVWHHLPDRGAFARDLSAALRPGGRLFVVDFAVAARRGPPTSMRVAPESIIAELEAAGLTAMVSAVAVPDQYIVESRRDP
jgi:2-polyprenyl-3-methyl-5-hydroxy-6-metoxy-1,4-benzoquinol methylase